MKTLPQNYSCRFFGHLATPKKQHFCRGYLSGVHPKLFFFLLFFRSFARPCLSTLCLVLIPINSHKRHYLIKSRQPPFWWKSPCAESSNGPSSLADIVLVSCIFKKTKRVVLKKVQLWHKHHAQHNIHYSNSKNESTGSASYHSHSKHLKIQQYKQHFLSHACVALTKSSKNDLADSTSLCALVVSSSSSASSNAFWCENHMVLWPAASSSFVLRFLTATCDIGKCK